MSIHGAGTLTRVPRTKIFPPSPLGASAFRTAGTGAFATRLPLEFAQTAVMA